MSFGKAYTEKGLQKRSNKYQVKKHYSDMTAEEKNYLHKYLLTIRKLDRHAHYIQRQEEFKHNIKIRDVFETIRSRNFIENIIEYNETLSKGRIEQRLLIRISRIYHKCLDGKTKPEKCYGFVVINLTTGQLITGYYNSIEDNHDSLNKFRYNSDLKIRPIKKGGYTWSEKQNILSNEMNRNRNNNYNRNNIRKTS